MSIKKILMAAVAVSALSAGVANAATISNTTTIATKSLAPAGVTITSNPYTIANEFIVSSGTVTAAGLLKVAPSANSVGPGQYVLTYNITGGTFTTTGVTVGKLALAINDVASAPVAVPNSVVNSVSSVSANSISFVVTIAPSEYLTLATLDNAILIGTARAPVSVSGSLKTASGVDVDGGAIAAKTVIDYRGGYTFGATAAAANALTLASGFKDFTTGTTTATIGTVVGFGVNTGADANDLVYSDASGTLAAASQIATAVLTLTGDVSAFVPKVDVQAADALTTNVFTADGTTLPKLKAVPPTATVTLAQKATPVAGNASSYSIAPVVTMTPVTLTAPTFSAAALGSITLAGTNFFASWVGDNSNGINYSIRLGNKSAAAVSSVKLALLNPYTTGTSGSVASTATCEVGPLPASGELVITSATLTGCFGAFKRSDVRITIQGLDSVLTAKMRTTAAGVVTEQQLGNGVVPAAQ